jgi:hypothetical protein
VGGGEIQRLTGRHENANILETRAADSGDSRGDRVGQASQEGCLAVGSCVLQLVTTAAPVKWPVVGCLVPVPGGLHDQHAGSGSKIAPNRHRAGGLGIETRP